jgi:hypothetical protein
MMPDEYDRSNSRIQAKSAPLPFEAEAAAVLL